tara:strand:+ start:241 stop:597 length:357 start_codon:yes stop_codon:yes gene_type:complete
MRIIINLTDEQLARLQRPISGSGGWQSLLRAMKKRIQGTTLELSTRDVGRILRYSNDYGSGGFQDRLKGPIEQTEELAIEILNALRISIPEKLMAPQARAGQSKAARSQIKKESKRTG